MRWAYSTMLGAKPTRGLCNSVEINEAIKIIINKINNKATETLLV